MAYINKKKTGTNFIIDLVIYPYDVMVSIAQSDEDFQKAIIKHLPPSCLSDFKKDHLILNLTQTQNGRCVNLAPGGQTIIRLKSYPETALQKGYLAHEVFHAISFILWRMGIKLEIDNSDEVYAYTIDYLTSQIYSRI